MSPQLSECPNCKRTFISRTNRRQPPDVGRCGVCGTPLIAGGETEAEVQRRLYGEWSYGRRVATTRAISLAGREGDEGSR